MTEDDVQAVLPIMENVGRLVEDASRLSAQKSFPIAFVLNVIALEEIGKIIQLRWRQLGIPFSSQKRTSHLQKQWAVACVLIGAKLLPYYKRIIFDEVSNEIGMYDLAAAFIDSDERRFFERVASIELDRSKQVGLYEDGVTLAAHSRDDIDGAFVLGLSEMMLKCMPLLLDELALQAGGVFFELLPKMTEAILAERHDY